MAKFIVSFPIKLEEFLHLNSNATLRFRGSLPFICKPSEQQAELLGIRVGIGGVAGLPGVRQGGKNRDGPNKQYTTCIV